MASTGPSTRSIARIFLTLVVLAAFLYLLYLVRSTIGLVFISLFLAVALGPPVDWVNRHRVPRGPAILLVYLLITLLVFGIGLLIVPPVVTQVQNLANDAPRYLQDLRSNGTFKGYDNRYHVTKKLEEQAKTLPSHLSDAAGALQSVTVGAFSAIVQLVTVLTIAYFLLVDGRRIADFFFGLLGPLREPRWRAIADDVYDAVSGYVAGNLLISLIAGTTAWVTLAVLGVPFAIPLALLVAFLDLIPLVGATIAGVVVLVVTLFNDFPTATIVWAVVFLIYQQVENSVLQPLVYRRTVDVSPLIVIVAILVGGSLLGVLGALVAIPIAATIQIIVKDVWANRASPIVTPDDTAVELPPGGAG